MRPGGARAIVTAGGALLVALVLPAVAGAHIERAAYWPDPRPDCSIHPCAGGRVPKARSLASALNRKPPGVTRVVCKADSLALLRRSIERARKRGYYVRPSVHRQLGARRARSLLAINRKLAKRCTYHLIQPAVTASSNNDRVVIMPGVYTEPESRAKPAFDPRCDKYLGPTKEGGTGALTYAGQWHCPNDQNLIAVLGRRPGRSPPPDPPRIDRHGIPDLGPCIRCNMQIEGSGVGADDVVIDAGRVASGDGGPRGSKKDVGIRADRADGFVLRNVTVRHAAEHDIYVLESDGYRLDRFKAFYAGEYGVLTFVEDHGLMENCEAAGNGDSGLYPGSGAKTAAGRDPRYYPRFRYSQEIRFCDSHHNTGGYSGTDGSATHIDHVNFYDNALGFTTDVFTAGGHPGFPEQGSLIDRNNFYSNNFNPYARGSDVEPSIPAPVGTGLWIAGGNDNVVRDNRFYDNWRRGVMLFAVPDVTVCGPVIGTEVTGCDPSKVSTSYGNRFYGNRMGVAPGGKARPNGVDFWWDAFPGNTGNCWYENVPAPGRHITSSPASLPNCANGSDPGASVGLGNVANEVELTACFAALSTGRGGYNFDPSLCPWFATPPRPRTAVASQWRDSRALATSPRVAKPHGGTGTAPPAQRDRATVQNGDCRDWRRLGRHQRRRLLATMRTFFGGAVDEPYGHGRALPPRAATRLLDSYCRLPFAARFKLYKLYGRAAAFTPPGVPGSG
jgi:hypothetical protein